MVMNNKHMYKQSNTKGLAHKQKEGMPQNVHTQQNSNLEL